MPRFSVICPADCALPALWGLLRACGEAGRLRYAACPRCVVIATVRIVWIEWGSPPSTQINEDSEAIPSERSAYAAVFLWTTIEVDHYHRRWEAHIASDSSGGYTFLHASFSWVMVVEERLRLRRRRRRQQRGGGEKKGQKDTLKGRNVNGVNRGVSVLIGYSSVCK